MKKTNAMRELDSAKIPYEYIEYDGENGRIDAVQIAKKIGVAPEKLFKTLIVENPQHAGFICVVPAAATLDLKKAAKAFGEKSLNMLPLKELTVLTGYVHGGCSPIGTKKKMPVVIDEMAGILDEMYVSGGHIGLSIKLAPHDLQRFTNALIADITS